MARINLLPWRKEQRERRNKEFNLLAGAVAGLAILATVLAFSLLNRDLSNQQAANKRIEDANAQLDVALKSIEELEAQREQMLSQMRVIQDLQGRRSVPVRVWDDMARAVPEAMYLTNIKREADVITLTGFADNPNVVATLVRNLNSSQWLDNSAVVSIKSKLEAYQETIAQPTTNAGDKPRPVYPEDNYIEFVVTTKVQNPQTAEEAQAQANTTDNQTVELPPVTVTTTPTAGNTAMPEVAPIGVDNVSTATSATTPSAAVTPENPNTANGATAQPTESNTNSPTNSSTAANSSTQAGGQQ